MNLAVSSSVVSRQLQIDSHWTTSAHALCATDNWQRTTAYWREIWTAQPRLVGTGPSL